MRRRNFIKNSALAVSSLSILPQLSCSAVTKPKYKMGLQLFTIRDAMEKNPLDSLKKVAALGYQDLETYGYDWKNKSYYGYKLSEFKKILEDLGLTATSGHYGFSDYFESSSEELKRFTDHCIEGALALGKDYITWPLLDSKYRNLENFKLLTDKLNAIGEQVNKGGLGFAYHNHGYEFVEYNGETAYDLITKQTDPSLVKLQMDLYWVKHSSKQSPSELIAKQPDRFVMWHIKDMDKVSRDYTELGNGSINYEEILAEIDMSGLKYYYLEQGGNFAENSMQSIADSAIYFKKNLQKYL